MPPRSLPPGQYEKDITTFTTRVDAVSVPVTVLDKKHQQVAGLPVAISDLREQCAPGYRFFQRRCCAALRCPGDRPEPAPGHDEESNDSLAAIQGGFTPADEVAVFTYADGVNNPTDFTAALSARLPAVLQASKEARRLPGSPHR